MSKQEEHPAPEAAETAEAVEAPAAKPPLPEAILAASQGLHIWQQDALRRIATGQPIDEKAIHEFAKMAIKEARGEAVPDATPLDISHLAPPASTQDVALRSISGVQNVNAIVSPKPMEFAPTGLTLVYGANGSGKSGYGKLLKSACFCRHRPEILPNVFAAPPRTDQSARLTYQVDAEDAPRTFDWTGAPAACADLQAVHVFDAESGDVFLTKEADVAYLPHGLSMFKTLADVCDAVKQQLGVHRGKLFPRLPKMGEELRTTAAGAWLGNLSSKTTKDDFDSMTAFGEEEANALRDCEEKIKSDPQRKAADIDAKARLLAEVLLSRLVQIDHLLVAQIPGYEQAVAAATTAGQMAKTASQQFFRDARTYPVPGVGSEAWRKLWEAALAFAESDAYPGKEYPSPEADHCVLCHQPLVPEARVRFANFKTYITGAAEKELAKAKQQAAALLQPLSSLVLTQDADAALFGSIVPYDPDLPQEIANYLAAAGVRRDFVVRRLSGELAAAKEVPALPTSPVPGLELVFSRMAKEAEEYEKAAEPEKMAKIKQECMELQARKWLHDNAQAIGDEMQRLQSLKVIDAAEGYTRSRPVTNKQDAVFAAYCTDQLRTDFEKCLHALGLRHLTVGLATKPRKGGQCQYLEVCNTTQIHPTVKAIASEGERRAIALAAFIAEVCSLPHHSGVVFDDPVSSLDHQFRVSVAKAISELARNRQVIVFTHDIYFLVRLIEECQDCKVSKKECQVLRFGTMVGYCDADVPFEVANLESQFSILNKLIRPAKDAQKSGDLPGYRSAIGDLHAKMRWAVETMIEEVYIGNVVKRYRQSISSLKGTKHLSVLDVEDCAFIDAQMDKYCYPLHTHGSDAPPKLPELEEIEADIAALKERRTIIKQKQKAV